MNKTRLEAFSDGVLAIIITIMVLEMKVPHGDQWQDLLQLAPVFISYIMSFTFIAIYWGNHHHLLHTVKHVNSGIIWANVHLLFWLSLIPFGTAWMGENHFGRDTVAVYGGLLFACGFAYYILQNRIIQSHHHDEVLRQAMARQRVKGIASQVGYLVGIFAVFIHPAISALLYASVSVMWLVPDQNIEKALRE